MIEFSTVRPEPFILDTFINDLESLNIHLPSDLADFYIFLVKIWIEKKEQIEFDFVYDNKKDKESNFNSYVTQFNNLKSRSVELSKILLGFCYVNFKCKECKEDNQQINTFSLIEVV